MGELDISSDQPLCPSCGEPLERGAPRCYGCGHSIVATTVIKARVEKEETQRIQKSAENRRREFELRAERAARRRSLAMAIAGGIVALVGVIVLLNGNTFPGLVIALAGGLVGYLGYGGLKTEASDDA